jgi:hypothetical protein
MVRSIVRPAVRRRISTWRAHFFLPDFLMPWPPVFRGPFPPAFLASSCLWYRQPRYFCAPHGATALRVAESRGFVATHRLAALPGKPCHPRRAPSLQPWASCCGWGWYRLLLVSVCVDKHMGGCWRGRASQRGVPPCPEGMLAVVQVASGGRQGEKSERGFAWATLRAKRL